MSETRLVPLNKIRDNPWRDRVRNPIDTERVETIATSIGKTKYWIGTYGRDTADGYVELAFGHHRYEAAKAQGLKEIPIIIEPFTDGEMLVWMASENVRGELPVVIEAVSAAVRALGEGKIELEAPELSTRKDAMRYAPSFIAGKGRDTTVVSRPYTALGLARYLGYIKKASNTAKDSVYAALGVLERAEIAGSEGGDTGKKKAIAMEQSLAALPVNQALQVVSNTKAREETVKQREIKTAAEAAAFDAKQRELAKAQKEAEEKAEAERKRLVDAKAAAIKAENEQRAKDIQARLDAKDAAAKVAAEEFVAKNLALEVKMAEAKTAAAEAKREDAYLPIRREVARIVHKVEQLQESLKEEAKAIARQPLNLKDREQLWQASDNLEGYANWLKSLFITSTTKQARRKNVRYTKC